MDGMILQRLITQQSQRHTQIGRVSMPRAVTAQDRMTSTPPRRALLQWDSREARSAKAALPEIRSCRKAMIFWWASSWVRVTVGSFQEDGRLTSLLHLQLLSRLTLQLFAQAGIWWSRRNHT